MILAPFSSCSGVHRASCSGVHCCWLFATLCLRSDSTLIRLRLRYFLQPGAGRPLQELLDDRRPLEVQPRTERMQLASEKYHATVRLSWNKETKTWLLTTFDQTVPPSTKRTSIVPDTPNASGETSPSPEGGPGPLSPEGNSGAPASIAPGGADPVFLGSGLGALEDIRRWLKLELAPMRLHLHVINDELARLGHTARLAKGPGYFYFESGEAGDWIDRTVGVRTINSLTLKQWIEEYRRLKALNRQILNTAKMKL